MWSEAARYEPTVGDDERELLLGRWREAVERSRGWAA
jgi:glycerol kinase